MLASQRHKNFFFVVNMRDDRYDATNTALNSRGGRSFLTAYGRVERRRFAVCGDHILRCVCFVQVYRLDSVT